MKLSLNMFILVKRKYSEWVNIINKLITVWYIKLLARYITEQLQ